MFNLLNQLSKGKVTWYLLISTVIFFEVGALYVQHRLHYSQHHYAFINVSP